MNSEDRTEAMRHLGALADLFERPLTASVIEIYLGALADLSIEEIREACVRAAKECKFFPRPVELRELVRGSKLDRAESAWVLLMEACHRNGDNSLFCADPHMAQAMLELFGSWVACYEEIVRLTPEMEASRRKQFLQLYQMAERRPSRSDLRYQPGRYEVNNREGSWHQQWIEKGHETLPQPVTVIDAAVSFMNVNFDLSTKLIASESYRQLTERQELIPT